MNDKKICFITCVNNDKYEKEEMHYISRLEVPEGYEIEILSIRGASSMTAGYNEGMRASDAKYKVYLHQDVFVVNKRLIYDLLELFKDDEIGMVGMVGAPVMPENGIMWNGPRVGKLYFNAVYMAGGSIVGDIEGDYEKVEAIDGLLMATQYDIPWREDLFDKWDFYDVSQSEEFIRKGYKVIVPNQVTPWCLHDDGFSNLKNYYGERKKFLKEYKC